MKRRYILLVVSIMFLALSPVFSYDGFGPAHKHFDLQTQVFKIVGQHWKVQELFYKTTQHDDPIILEEYNEACALFKKQSQDLGKKILTQVEDPNREVIGVISEIYKSLDLMARQALYPSLAYLKGCVNQEFKLPFTDADFREYFPGYGYTEPGYKYRKGREIERENKGVTWQSEEHTITTTWKVEITITLDLLSILKGMAAGGTIKNLKVHEQYETNMGGEPIFVAKVSFETVKTISTKTNRKFDVNKIWFELLRAKASNWGTPGPWEVCGKTYEIINEPTGEEVVTGIKEGTK